MKTQRYKLTQHSIADLLTWVKSGEIAIPDIQRPFVWTAVKTRDLLDSLYHGYPIGYLIAWRNPSVRLRDGTTSSGKRILIDEQQRITALRSAVLGHEVLDKNYRKFHIRIAFHPGEQRFEVHNPTIHKNLAWIPDLSSVLDSQTSCTELTDDYLQRNREIERDKVESAIARLLDIKDKPVGVIELDGDLDIEAVTEIFSRVNSKGVHLNQTDLVMSKIAANETEGGNLLRKTIDYFCHLCREPDFLSTIEANDPEFTASEFLPKMLDLQDSNNALHKPNHTNRWRVLLFRAMIGEGLYKPDHTDMLRVAFTSQFDRANLRDLIALLSGRNFETRENEEKIMRDSFARLKTGILHFIDPENFQELNAILQSAGFVTSKMVANSHNAINFAYIIYLRALADKSMSPPAITSLVRRWYVMSLLSTRSTSIDTTIESDIRNIEKRGLTTHADTIIDAQMSPDYWDKRLPLNMETSSASSPYFLVYQAAQAFFEDRVFLTRDATMRKFLSSSRSEVHHIYPKKYLEKQGLGRTHYNQIANLVLTPREINKSINDTPPERYFPDLAEQCEGGLKRYGPITDIETMRANLAENCIPDSLLQGEIPDYDTFLHQRRHLMAQKIKTYFEKL